MRQRALPLIFSLLLTCVSLFQVCHAAEPARVNSSTTAKPGQRVTPSVGSANVPNAATLDERVQAAKRDAIQLNRDLQVLEEELLYPASTQFAVFVSLDAGKSFALDSVQISLDDKVVTNYLYKPQELQALQRGGVQRLYLANLKVGEHELVATFTGAMSGDRNYKRSATVKFEKGIDAKYIQLRIEDPAAKQQPDLAIKVWQ